MAAQWMATFDCGKCQEGFIFASADSRSFKPEDIRDAKTKAREKARKIAKKRGIKGKLIGCRCVG